MSHSSPSFELWTIPELGPSLGRLIDPPQSPPGAGAFDVVLDDIRLELVTGIFDMVGAARSFAAAGDRQGAIASLGRVAWLDRWERAVGAAAQRLSEAVNARLQHAAAESRLPAAKLAQVLLSPEDTRAIASRIGSGGAGLVSALDALEQTVPAASASGSRGRIGQDDWQQALATTARRLESSWLALEAGSQREEERWTMEIQRVRSWRRPVWPLWLITALVLGLASYVGLVLGGYLTAPAFLHGFAQFWWSQ